MESILDLSPNYYFPVRSKGVREDVTLKSFIVLRLSSSFSIILDEKRFDFKF